MKKVLDKVVTSKRALLLCYVPFLIALCSERNMHMFLDQNVISMTALLPCIQLLSTVLPSKCEMNQIHQNHDMTESFVPTRAPIVSHCWSLVMVSGVLFPQWMKQRNEAATSSSSVLKRSVSSY